MVSNDVVTAVFVPTETPTPSITPKINDIFAGYAVSGSETQPHTYLDVKGEWDVTKIHCPLLFRPITQSAVWIGLGGTYTGNDKTIAQIGVYSTCSFIGIPDFGDEYYPVFEMFPDPVQYITKAWSDKDNKPVKPVVEVGDKIFAEVRYDPKGNYILTLRDITRKWHTNLPPQTFKGKDKDPPANRYSAEWIVEAPKSKLAQFDPVTFANAQVDGKPITSGPVVKQINMVISPSDRTVRAETGPLYRRPQVDNTGNWFDVTWKHE